MVARRKGRAFPHSQRRSRKAKPVVWSVIWTSLCHGVPLRDHGEGIFMRSDGPQAHDNSSE